MFDRLIDVFLQFIDLFKFWTVIDQFERGVVLRLGKYNRTLEPGLHFTYPFNLDVVLTDNVVPRTVNMGCQSLVTIDGKAVVVSAIITAQIRDVQKALLEVENVNQALTDSCFATIGDLVIAHSWTQIKDPEFAETVFKACRKQAFKYGIEILRVQFADLVTAKAYRILREA
jgi:regulator of protease activity HflC (stomatin/prohibitin superfamily)